MCKNKKAEIDVTYWLSVTEYGDQLQSFTCLRPCFTSLKKITAWFKGDYKHAGTIGFGASIAVKKHDETLEQFLLRLIANGQRVDYILYICKEQVIKIEDASFNYLYSNEEQNK